MGQRRTDPPLPAAKYLQAPPSLPPIPPPPLATGLPELDALLPGRGLAWGSVVELMAPRGLALSTSLALLVCAAAQQQAERERRAIPWCAFVDPTRSLHAAGVAASGVRLERLLVVRPPADATGRAAQRLASSRLFSVLVVDTGGVPGAIVSDSLGPWVALSRRLASAPGLHTISLLLTHREAGRSLPLPVADRIELTQERPGQLLLRRHQHRYGVPSDWQPCAMPLREPLTAAVEAS